MLTLTAAGYTDPGRVRSENQDRYLADPAHGLYLVTDGMGGAFAGALAAQLVVTCVPALLEARLSAEADLASTGKEVVRATLVTLSEQVRRASREQLGRAGMGATIVMALIRQEQALIAHLGDSRAYLLHAGQLTCLTRDHSLAEILLEAGELTTEEAAQHPGRTQLTRYIGMPREVLPETHAFQLAPGDRLLLCSDGVWKSLSSEDLCAALQPDEPPQYLCQRVVTAAIAARDDDNCTALVITFQSASPLAADQFHPRRASY